MEQMEEDEEGTTFPPPSAFSSSPTSVDVERPPATETATEATRAFCLFS